MEQKWLKAQVSEKNYEKVHIYKIRNRFRNLSGALDDILNKFFRRKK